MRKFLMFFVVLMAVFLMFGLAPVVEKADAHHMLIQAQPVVVDLGGYTVLSAEQAGLTVFLETSKTTANYLLVQFCPDVAVTPSGWQDYVFRDKGAIAIPVNQLGGQFVLI